MALALDSDGIVLITASVCTMWVRYIEQEPVTDKLAGFNTYAFSGDCGPADVTAPNNSVGLWARLVHC